MISLYFLYAAAIIFMAF